MQIGLVPNTEFLKGTVELSRFGEIVVDAKCHQCARHLRRRRRDDRALQADHHRHWRGRQSGALGLRLPYPDTCCGRLKKAVPPSRSPGPPRSAQNRSGGRCSWARGRLQTPSSSCSVGDMYWIRPRSTAGCAALGGKQHQRPGRERAGAQQPTGVGGVGQRVLALGCIHQASATMAMGANSRVSGSGLRWRPAAGLAHEPLQPEGDSQHQRDPGRVPQLPGQPQHASRWRSRWPPCAARKRSCSTR